MKLPLNAIIFLALSLGKVSFTSSSENKVQMQSLTFEEVQNYVGKFLNSSDTREKYGNMTLSEFVVLKQSKENQESKGNNVLAKVTQTTMAQIPTSKAKSTTATPSIPETMTKKPMTTEPTTMKFSTTKSTTPKAMTTTSTTTIPTTIKLTATPEVTKITVTSQLTTAKGMSVKPPRINPKTKGKATATKPLTKNSTTVEQTTVTAKEMTITKMTAKETTKKMTTAKPTTTNAMTNGIPGKATATKPSTKESLTTKQTITNEMTTTQTTEKTTNADASAAEIVINGKTNETELTTVSHKGANNSNSTNENSGGGDNSSNHVPNESVSSHLTKHAGSFPVLFMVMLVFIVAVYFGYHNRYKINRFLKEGIVRIKERGNGYLKVKVEDLDDIELPRDANRQYIY